MKRKTLRARVKDFYLEILNTGERPILEKKFEEVIPEFQFAYQYVVGNYVKNKSVLDIGCGGGYGTEYLSRFTKKNVVGYDIDKKTIAITKKFYRNKKITFTSKFDDLNKKNFDVVGMFQVIEHFTEEEMHKMLASITNNLLKKDGIFICSTPNKLVTSPGLEKPVMVFHNFEFIPSTLKVALKKHFKHVTILGQPETNSQRFKKSNTDLLRIKWTRILSQIELVRMIARHLPIRLKYLFMGNLVKDPRTYRLATSTHDINKSFTIIAVCKN